MSTFPHEELFLFPFPCQAWSVPEVLRPLYESSTVLAQKSTMAVRIVQHLELIVRLWSFASLMYLILVLLFSHTQALRQLRQMAQDISQTNISNWGRRPAALRALGHRLSRSGYSTSHESAFSCIWHLMCTIFLVMDQGIQRGSEWIRWWGVDVAR